MIFRTSVTQDMLYPRWFVVCTFSSTGLKNRKFAEVLVSA